MNTKVIAKNIKLLASVVFSILVISSSCMAATYYVDNVNGNDTNNGLSTSVAWKTISKVNASKFQPGDQILFASGHTWREQLNIPSSGVAGSPIIFGAYGNGEKPIISGANLITGLWTQYSSNTYSIALSTLPKRVWWGTTELTNNTSGYQNLTANQFNYSSGYLYINIGKNPAGEAIEAIQRDYCINWNKSYVTVDGLHLTKSNWGISQWSAEADYGVVQNCLLDYMGRMGIYVGQSATITSKFWTVQNNTFSYNGTDNSKDHNMYIKWATNWTIQNNRFIGLKNKVNAAINLNGSSNNVIRYNYSEGHQTTFVQCYEDTAGGSQYNQIYYNVSNGDGNLIYMGGGSNHLGSVVYNNTAYNYSYSGISIDSGSLASVKNNIFWSPISTKTYVNASGTSIGTNSNNLTTNPSFVKAGVDFHLASNSPAIKSGTNLSLTRDLEGNAVPSGSAPDLGAYQFRGTTTASINPPANLRVQ